LDKRESLHLLASSFAKTYKRNENVYSVGDRSENICYLHSGKVKIYLITEEGDEVIILIAYPHQLFALTAFYADGLWPFYCTAMKESLVRFIPKDVFSDIIARNHKFASTIIAIMGARMYHLALLIHDLFSRDVQSRLANLLLKISRQESVFSGTQVRIIADLTHEEIGNIINARRQTVTSALGVFEREGIIKKEGKQIIIVDLERLRHLTL
jgi:CRP/FNR family transcriptional regulator